MLCMVYQTSPPITFNISHVPKPSESNVYKVNTEIGIRPSHSAGPCNPRSLNCHSQTPNSFYSWSMILYIHIYIYTGWWFYPSWKMWKWVGINNPLYCKMLETTHQVLYVYIYIHVFFMTVGHLILILLRSSNAPEVFSTLFLTINRHLILRWPRLSFCATKRVFCHPQRRSVGNGATPQRLVLGAHGKSSSCFPWINQLNLPLSNRYGPPNDGNYK